jgi:N-acetyl-1-D-myo-inositol-2-amino-2-deoxy-alpha-D-glucopyranoside deacetylase
MMRLPDPLDLTRSKRLLVVAPHPDDETLATGGLLQRSIAAGGTVRVVFVTDGENNPWPQRVIERKWRLGPHARARWAERRRAETLDALSCLGIPASSAVFLHFPDQGLTSLLLAGGGSLLPALAAEISTWRPTLVAAPALVDRHPDHNAVAVLLRLAVDRLAGAHGAFAELAYVVHGEVPAGALQLPLAPVQRARKYAAILHHRSQLVLSKRRFLSHATETECFVDPATTSPAHRVVGSAFASGTLSLRLVAPTAVAGLRPTLHVLTEDDPGCVVRLRSRRVTRWQHEIDFPMDRVPARLLAKCEVPHVFFDAAGWREIPVQAPTEVAGRHAKEHGRAPLPVAVTMSPR